MNDAISITPSPEFYLARPATIEPQSHLIIPRNRSESRLYKTSEILKVWEPVEGGETPMHKEGVFVVHRSSGDGTFQPDPTENDTFEFIHRSSIVGTIEVKEGKKDA